MGALRILCLVGSPTTDFYRELSELYTRGCLVALNDTDRYEFTLAHLSPGPTWRLPLSLDPADLAAAPEIPFGEAMRRLAIRSFDVALPQMFCIGGMTHYRSLIEMMGLPYLGNRPTEMAIAANKALARAVVAAAGVDVPRGEQLRQGDRPTIPPRAVVKPRSADNSDGVTLVSDRAEYPVALATAFEHDAVVLVEAYIELGREVRCGVLQRGDELICLPLEEYFVDELERPIRMPSHKLRRNDNGELRLAAKERTESWIVDESDPAIPRVHEAAKRCHVALGCRQYSLFDFRVDPDGRPWFLEAGLYCSFSQKSVVATMAAAAGITLDALFDHVVAEALGRSPLAANQSEGPHRRTPPQ